MLSNTSKNCDCFIGYLSSEDLRKSTIEYNVRDLARLMPKLKEIGLMAKNKQPLSPKEIVDNRRGNLHRFTYCPYCGVKIDWKEILSIFV